MAGNVRDAGKLRDAGDSQGACEKSLLEQMKTGELYVGTVELDEPELMQKFYRCKDLLYDFNLTRYSELEKRTAILREVFPEMGENVYIEPPFYANWGCNVHVGNNFYANFGLTVVDDADIFIGNDVMIAPHVTLATAGHPLDPDLRKQVLQFNMPIHIGNNVWIGAHAVVLPGVTIGDNSVIGAGSIVTKDIPAGVLALGSPCHVVREIGEHDREFYYKERRVPERWRYS